MYDHFDQDGDVMLYLRQNPCRADRLLAGKGVASQSSANVNRAADEAIAANPALQVEYSSIWINGIRIHTARPVAP